MKIFAVRSTTTEALALEQLVGVHGYASASAALRAGLMALPEFSKMKYEARERIKLERIVHGQRKPKAKKEEKST